LVQLKKALYGQNTALFYHFAASLNKCIEYKTDFYALLIKAASLPAKNTELWFTAQTAY
jgi:hypothetical protein